MRNITDLIIDFHHQVTEAVRAKLDGELPKKGLGGTYAVKDDGHATKGIRLYSQVAVPPSNNALEWGALRTPCNGVEIPIMENLRDMSKIEFLEKAAQVNIKGLSPFELYIEHFESYSNKPNGVMGQWLIRSNDFETVTSEKRVNFKGLSIDIKKLVGMPLNQAVDLYLEGVFGMYKQAVPR